MAYADIKTSMEMDNNSKQGGNTGPTNNFSGFSFPPPPGTGFQLTTPVIIAGGAFSVVLLLGIFLLRH